MGTCYWVYDTMHQYGGLSAPAGSFVLLLFALYLGLYHGLFGVLASILAYKQASNRFALVCAPFLWVAIELARTRISGFPWNLLGISQVDNVALCQITSSTGVYGVSFEIALVNVAFAMAFLVLRPKRGMMFAAALAAAVVLQAGRLVDAPPAKTDRAALLVQQNIPVSANWTPVYFQQTLQQLTELTKAAAGSKREPKIDL